MQKISENRGKKICEKCGTKSGVTFVGKFEEKKYCKKIEDKWSETKFVKKSSGKCGPKLGKIFAKKSRGKNIAKNYGKSREKTL